MQRIAVTGANGYVGRHVVRHAAAEGMEVVGVVRSESAGQQVAQDGGRPLVLMGRDPDAFARGLERCEAVVHLAQIGAERGGSTYEAVNVGFTERVCREAERAGVRRIVFFSGLGVSRYGMNRRSTNPYFLSKRAAETVLQTSPLETIVFRPSFVVGPGDGFVASVMRTLASGDLERPGDGTHRMQPIAVADATASVVAALRRPRGAFPHVFDLVGPEPIAYARLLERLVAVARREGHCVDLRVREVPIAEADRRARAGGCLGMLPDELDCLLCDEVSEPAPLVALLGRPLTPLDEALAAAVRALASRPACSGC